MDALEMRRKMLMSTRKSLLVDMIFHLEAKLADREEFIEELREEISEIDYQQEHPE